jgi:hypothetical protein
VPRLKKKWTVPPVAEIPKSNHTHSDTPAHPNVVQAARHFGTTPSAFRRLAIRERFKRVRVGNKDTYDLKEMNEWWERQAKAA